MKDKKIINIASLLFLLIIQINAVAQTELELLKSRANLYMKDGDEHFNKAFKYYLEQNHDSCYLYSSICLRKNEIKSEINNDKIEILNYLQGVSAAKKSMLDKSLRNFRTISDSSNYRNLKRFWLGYINTMKENYDIALFNYSFWMKESERSNRNIIKTVLHNISICYLLNKNYIEAEKYMKKEERLIEKGDTATLISLKMDFANIYYNQYKDSIAIPLFYESYNLANMFSDLKKKRVTSKNIAVIEKNRKNYKESVQYYEEFIKWNDSIWNRDKVWELTEKDKQLALAEKNREILIKEEELKRESLEKILVMLVSSFLIVVILVYFWIRRRKIIYENKLETLEKTNKERNRISKELHDGILGKLFGVRFGLGFMELKTDKETLEKYEQFLNELKDIEKEIRDVSHRLNKPVGIEIDFFNEIEKMIQKKSLIGNFEYSLDFSKPEKLNFVTSKIKFEVLRVLEEAFQNIIKHSKADKVQLKIELIDKSMHLELKDDGLGFALQLLSQEGIGISNMRSRVEEMKGEFLVLAKIDFGTTIKLKIPLKTEKV
ncbi:Histidine kinase-, DNA gyrase B-, and HSP90-like ATPase [Tenacibaculum sp. MAR_2009_124]|uniref:sensor histidine kinase n=1 Tax=Tenacibaculum sp. MAR_2009_124 TaxID=1250059 RepID=UPI000894C892|nr:ATP-binding protein [Tenacibaculum sp. MAR_2009_124]SEB51046.1 Histidine kinase-, DNA gyrase B-, and HSP90-like ATPase [Tenacibaculum sp. MAR_2009_124]